MTIIYNFDPEWPWGPQGPSVSELDRNSEWETELLKYYLKDCVECVELMNEFDDVNCELWIVNCELWIVYEVKWSSW